MAVALLELLMLGTHKHPPSASRLLTYRIIEGTHRHPEMEGTYKDLIVSSPHQKNGFLYACKYAAEIL